MIEGTCKKEKCPFFKEHGKECPFLVETWWHTNDGDKHLVEDCAPVRSLLMQQEYYNRSIALQKSHEEARNEIHRTNTKLDQTMEQTKNFILEADRQLYEMRKSQKLTNRLTTDRKVLSEDMGIEELDYEL